MLPRSGHARLIAFENDPVRNWGEIGGRFSPGCVGRLVTGAGSGGHDREDGKADAEPHQCGNFASAMEPEAYVKAERDSDDERGDQAS